MIMIMEQYQQSDGTIRVPKALQKYMDMEVIEGKLNKMTI
jgi:seryl-tRNA synthetase